MSIAAQKHVLSERAALINSGFLAVSLWAISRPDAATYGPPVAGHVPWNGLHGLPQLTAWMRLVNSRLA